MTVPGGESGENAQDDIGRPRPEQPPAEVEHGNPPPFAGFESHPGPPPGYPPAPGFDPPPAPPPGYPAGPPPGYPLDYPPDPPPGYGYPSGPPGYPLGGPPPGYPPGGFQAPGYPPGGFRAPGYGAPYPHRYGGPRPRTNSLAITSLVLSIIGLVPRWGGLLSLVAIVLGGLALNQIKKTGEAGSGLAVAGMVVGGVSLVIGLIVAIAVLPYGS